MLYRCKLLIALLQAFGGSLDKLRLQKLLFILSQNQTAPSFDFLPYKFGCCSFQSYADLSKLVSDGHIQERLRGDSISSGKWVVVDRKDYLKALKTTDVNLIESVKKQFVHCSNEALLRYTYTRFPYYAIRSAISEKILSWQEIKLIEDQRPQSKGKTLFTIGYEGISIENFLNKLIRNNINILCDVRKNPNSRKYGFSKNRLMNFCTNLGIIYSHLPELGIESSQRRGLRSQRDFDSLFERYRRTTLIDEATALDRIMKLLLVHPRVALLCFEANIAHAIGNT